LESRWRQNNWDINSPVWPLHLTARLLSPVGFYVADYRFAGSLTLFLMQAFGSGQFAGIFGTLPVLGGATAFPWGWDVEPD